MIGRGVGLSTLDIRNRVAEIEGITYGKSLEDYQSSSVIRAVVERHFIIIGEAVNGIRRIDPAVAASVPHLAEIIAFRNVLVHGYHSINDRRVWSVVTDHLGDPRLAMERITPPT